MHSHPVQVSEKPVNSESFSASSKLEPKFPYHQDGSVPSDEVRLAKKNEPSQNVTLSETQNGLMNKKIGGRESVLRRFCCCVSPTPEASDADHAMHPSKCSETEKSQKSNFNNTKACEEQIGERRTPREAGETSSGFLKLPTESLFVGKQDSHNFGKCNSLGRHKPLYSEEALKLNRKEGFFGLERKDSSSPAALPLSSRDGVHGQNREHSPDKKVLKEDEMDEIVSGMFILYLRNTFSNIPRAVERFLKVGMSKRDVQEISKLELEDGHSIARHYTSLQTVLETHHSAPWRSIEVRSHPVLQLQQISDEEEEHSVILAKQQLLMEQRIAGQASLFDSLKQNLGFDGERPVAAIIVFRSCLKWKAMQKEKNTLFDRIIETIGEQVASAHDNNTVLGYWLTNTAALYYLMRKYTKSVEEEKSSSITPRLGLPSSSTSRNSYDQSDHHATAGLSVQFEVKYPALLFRQQSGALVETIFSMLRDNMKIEISHILGAYTRATESSHLNGSDGKGGPRRRDEQTDTHEKDSPATVHWKEILKSLDNNIHILKDNHVPPLLVSRLMEELFDFVNVQLFNRILFKMESSFLCNIESEKMGLEIVEQWIMKAGKSWIGNSWEKLQHFRQAIKFLAISDGPKRISNCVVKSVYPLSVQQIYCLGTRYWGDCFDKTSESNEMLSEAKRQMEEDGDQTQRYPFLLEDDPARKKAFCLEDIGSVYEGEDLLAGVSVPSALPKDRERLYSFLELTKHFYREDSAMNSHVEPEALNLPCLRQNGNSSGSQDRHSVSVNGEPSLERMTPISPVKLNMQIEEINSEINSNLLIDYSKLTDLRLIGEGYYGKVYVAEYSGFYVAVKKIKREILGQKDEYPPASNRGLVQSMFEQQVLPEVRMLKALSHQHVVRLYGYCMSPPAIVMELCARGSLYELIRRCGWDSSLSSLMTWHRRLSMARQIAHALDYLHNRPRPMLHRDLRSLNVVITENLEAKLADLGLSKFKDEVSSCRGGSMRNLNPRWLAREILQGEAFTMPSEIYSYGVIMWEILTWKQPWGDLSDEAVKLAKITSDLDVPREDEWDGLPGPKPAHHSTLPDFTSLISKCLCRNPRKRPSFPGIIQSLDCLLEQERS